jgi:homoserine kinase type II
MAVFTPLTKSEIENFIEPHSIGKLISFEGILQGVDNTNYKIETTSGKYILTVFEKRINPNDIPYFLGLMEHLNKSGIICPTQVIHANQIKNKPAALFSFLDGRGTEQNDITPILCHELGILLGKMHVVGQSFPMTRKNSMSFDAWETRLNRVGNEAKPFLEKLAQITSNWPENLPTGAIHADLFPDNVFIKDNHIDGVIDFYFSATDFLVYDLAIVMNAWCFDETIFNQDKWQMLLNGYQSIRKLTQPEKDSYQTICQGAAMRFLSSRLHDFVFHDPQNLVTPKPPTEYIEKLEFHLNVKLF